MPYVWSVTALGIGYGATLLLSKQPALAVGIAALCALVGYGVCRVVQMRGRLSLALTAIGLPLIFAVACTVVLKLTPFIDRQRSIAEMRKVGISFRARNPNECDEWLQDGSGNMLPIWLANWIGPHSMAQIRWLNADLDSFQSIRFDRIERTLMFKAEFNRLGTEPTVAPELVAWLDGSPALERPTFTLQNFTEADALALQGFSNKDFSAQLSIDKNTKGLDRLTNVTFLELTTDELTTEQAADLSTLGRLQWLAVSCLDLTPLAIAALDELPKQVHLSIQDFNVDIPHLESLAALDRFNLGLARISVELESMQAIPPAVASPADSSMRYLTIADSTIDLASCAKIASRLLTTHLSLENITPESDSDRDQSEPIDTERFESLKVAHTLEEVASLFEMAPGLQEIMYFGASGWQTVTRPGAED